MTSSIGYLKLIEIFNLKVCDLLLKSYATDKSQKEVRADGYSTSVFYPRARVELGETWQENLAFAIKYEGVNLEVLKALFGALSNRDLSAFVLLSPHGTYSRRVWFLYEWLTGTQLSIPDLQTGNYVTVIDEKLQIAIPVECAIRERRYKILNNLIGTPAFCPMARSCPIAPQETTSELMARTKFILADYPVELIYRAVKYLFAKETKSSFAIERETPSQKRANAFVEILSRQSNDIMDKTRLIGLQNAIVDERYRQFDWRTDQVYVGETLVPGQEKVHFIAAKPEDVGDLMTGFLATLSHWMSARNADPIAIAAVMSFAFVFIHPFDDGNGRIHRYLMHDILSHMGFTPSGMIFPVSAVLLKNPLVYDRLLETFSRRAMNQLEYAIDSNGEISVTHASADLYRYIDFTPIVAGFRQIIRETIETEWKSELEYLRNYDAIRAGMRDVVDLPEKKANQFIHFVQNNGGTLSQRKRHLFAELTDQEIAQLEAVISNPLL